MAIPCRIIVIIIIMRRKRRRGRRRENQVFLCLFGFSLD
jgi:hypothetical protein